MENYSWKWNKKALGNWKIGAEISSHLQLLEQLDKLEYEDYDVYRIANTNSKLFVKLEEIIAIQAGEIFIYEGVNLIGLPIKQVLNLLDKELGSFVKVNEREYNNLELGITIYLVDELVRWITIYN